MTQTLAQPQTLSPQFQAKTTSSSHHGWEGERYTGEVISPGGTVYYFSLTTDADFLKYMRSFDKRPKLFYMDKKSGIHQLRVTTMDESVEGDGPKVKDVLCFFDGEWLQGKKPETGEHEAILDALKERFPRHLPDPAAKPAPNKA